MAPTPGVFRLVIDQRTLRAHSKRLARLPQRLAVAWRRQLRVIGDNVVTEMQRRIRGGGALRNRSGFLKRSFGKRVFGRQLGELRLIVFSAGIPYARIQEYGGVVTPKRAKALTIPFKKFNLTPAGVPRYPSAAQFKLAHPGETFFVPKKGGGNTIGTIFWHRFKGLGGRSGASVRGRGKPIPLWTLVKRVKLKPRLGFRRTWRKMRSMNMIKLRGAARRTVRKLGM